MLLENIVSFYRIAEEKSISKVAQSTHISQPALSQQMQRLEEELGIKLFERSNRGIELTQAGNIMKKYAYQFIQSYELLKEEIDNLKTDKGTFRIAATPVACNYALPCTLYKVSSEFKAYSFSLNCFTSAEVLKQIQNGQADLGFIVSPSKNSDYICKKAFVDKIYLVVKADYIGNLPESLDELKQYPLLMLTEESSSYRLVCDYLKQQGHSIENMRVTYHLNTTEALKSAVLSGHGFAFLSYMAVKKDLYQKEIKIIELRDFSLDYDIYSIYKSKEDSYGSSTREIMDYLISTINKSIC